MEPQNKRWVLWSLVGLILVGTGIYLFTKSKAIDSETPVVGQNENDASNSIFVADQESDSLAANVGLLITSSPGFVAIHEDDDGKPGKIIGNSGLLSRGTHVNVPVIASLKSGEVYWAVFHTDDGNGVFDEENDKPSVDATGATVMMAFDVGAPQDGLVKGVTKG